MDLSLNDRITGWLKSAHPFWFSLYAASAAFCLYTCVYTFRKAFSVATFDEMVFGGISYKVWLVTFQVFGYALSKFIGIRVIAELKTKDRARGILLMSCIAAASWLFFAIIPAPFDIIFLFTNGLPLGLIWGMIFSYLEGRRTTELLGAGLSVSFIFSSGFSKTVGALTMREWNVTEQWMPFVTAMIFILPLIVFVWMMERLPPPSEDDIRLRTKRKPMNKADRRSFVRAFLPGIILFVLAYILLTAYRDFRDNFAAEIWTALGYGESATIYTATEIPVALVVLVIMGSMMLIRDNMKVLMINHIIILAGMLTIGLSTLAFERNLIGGPAWMILIGLGLYLGYVPFNSIFFDRLIAAFHYVGTVGFIMYVADSFGYLGSVAVLMFKEFGFGNAGWLSFFTQAGYWISIPGAIMIFGSMAYFTYRQKVWASVQSPRVSTLRTAKR